MAWLFFTFPFFFCLVGVLPLQLKTWNGDGSGLSGRQNEHHADVKGQLLSYVTWIYGINTQSGDEMGKWPPNMSGNCQFARTSKSASDEYMYVCVCVCVPRLGCES